MSFFAFVKLIYKNMTLQILIRQPNKNLFHATSLIN